MGYFKRKNENNDKNADWKRYEKRAKKLLEKNIYLKKHSNSFGSAAILPTLRTPYLYYEKCIFNTISGNNYVLEIGSGTGLHTYSLTKTGAKIVASDISKNSLTVLNKIIDNVITVVADMENLPFKDGSFDVVCSAGSLSYGDPDIVDAEIKRILKPGGKFICVDSLNHNPIYRINRWIKYLKGERSKNTLKRIPNTKRIKSIAQNFKHIKVKYFGAVTFLMPILSKMFGQDNAAKISDIIDKVIKVKKLAFKFVLIAEGRN